MARDEEKDVLAYHMARASSVIFVERAHRPCGCTIVGLLSFRCVSKRRVKDAVTELRPATAAVGMPSRQSFDLERPLREARSEFEKGYFEFHLTKANGSMTRVAERTGIGRTHLYRKLKQLGLDYWPGQSKRI